MITTLKSTSRGQVRGGDERLLDEAGYPRGADGVRFKTVFTGHPAPALTDVGYTEIIMQFWDAIGVDVELEIAEGAAFGPMIQGSTYKGIIWFITGWNRPLPVTTVGWQATGAYNNATGHSVPGISWGRIMWDETS